MTTIAAAAAAVLMAACGSSASTTGNTTAPAASASPASCHAQYEAWKNGPARAAGKAAIAQFRAIKGAAAAADFPRVTAGLKEAGRAAAALQAYPMPRCADPHGYWAAILTRLRSAADNASFGSGLGALMLAIVPLKEIPPLEQKLSAELHQTVGASKVFA
jgi:hypothetical protein